MKNSFFTFIKFVLMGLLATAVDFSIYQFLIDQDLNLNFSKGLGYLGGIISAYAGNTLFTFRTKKSNAFRFVIVYLFGFVLNVTTNFALVFALDWKSKNFIVVSWIFATICSAVSNFLMLKHWVYSKESTRE